MQQRPAGVTWLYDRRLCVCPLAQGGVQAMERAVEPWGADLHGQEQREPLRGARTGEDRAQQGQVMVGRGLSCWALPAANLDKIGRKLCLQGESTVS